MVFSEGFWCLEGKKTAARVDFFHIVVIPRSRADSNWATAGPIRGFDPWEFQVLLSVVKFKQRLPRRKPPRLGQLLAMTDNYN